MSLFNRKAKTNEHRRVREDHPDSGPSFNPVTVTADGRTSTFYPDSDLTLDSGPSPSLITNQAEPIRAWKAAKTYRIADGRLILSGITHGRYNADDVAVCNVGGDHVVPDKDCTCGFWAVETRQHAETIANVSGVVLEVDLFGTVDRYTRGYRASRQRVIRAFLPRPNCVAYEPDGSYNIRDGAGNIVEEVVVPRCSDGLFYVPRRDHYLCAAHAIDSRDRFQEVLPDPPACDVPAFWRDRPTRLPSRRHSGPSLSGTPSVLALAAARRAAQEIRSPIAKRHLPF